MEQKLAVACATLVVAAAIDVEIDVDVTAAGVMTTVGVVVSVSVTDAVLVVVDDRLVVDVTETVFRRGDRPRDGRSERRHGAPVLGRPVRVTLLGDFPPALLVIPRAHGPCRRSGGLQRWSVGSDFGPAHRER